MPHDDLAPPPPPHAPARPEPLGSGVAGVRRRTDDRLLGGVAGGLGRWLGVDPVLVRIGFVTLTFAGGVGLVLYGALWALLPTDPSDLGGRHLAADARPRRASGQQAVALSLITLGVLLLLRRAGLWFGDAVVWPLVVAAAGSAIVWTRGDADHAPRPVGAARRWTSRLDASTPGAVVAPPTSWPRVAVGTALVALAVFGFLAGNVALVAVRELGLAVLAAAAGVVLLLGPWLSRVAGELGTERRERVRSEERAALAAHLHDSVLQTLALIQRSADEPRRVQSLARVQERELRAWLYGAGTAPDGAPRTLAAAVEATVTEVEVRHELTVDAVVVGDLAVDDGVEALLGAVREALTNVAKHAEVATADLYVEVEDEAVTAFVRDRGRGFDPAAAGHDDDHRRGLRDSIHGRLARHDGSARVTSAPGRGTEVELRLPRPSRTEPS